LGTHLTAEGELGRGYFTRGADTAVRRKTPPAQRALPAIAWHRCSWLKYDQPSIRHRHRRPPADGTDIPLCTFGYIVEIDPYYVHPVEAAPNVHITGCLANPGWSLAFWAATH
jgi:hypothetical protein